MSHLVFARKFRPQSFEEVVSQRHIVKALKNSVLKDRIGHAYLFTGPRGVGKTTMARIFARAINCPEPEPCGKCEICEEITNSKSLGVWEIDGASNNSVENVRSLIDSLRTLPPEGYKFKVYIVDEVHMLSTAAFNALLKSLEEPPPNTVFIFATTEPHKIPETVISRCQRFDFKQISASEIADQLTDVASQEGFELDPAAAMFLARKAGGAMRDALSMLERLTSFSEDKLIKDSAFEVFSAVDPTFFFKLSKQILDQDAGAAVSSTIEAFESGPDIKAFLSDFLGHFRNLMLVKLGVENRYLEGWTESDIEEAKTQLSNTSNFDIQRLYKMADAAASDASRSLHPEYLIEAGIARLASQAKAADMSQLLAGKLTSSPSVKPKSTSPASPMKAVDLSWGGFLKFVQKARRPVLHSLLLRVEPASFGDSKMEVKATEFDAQSIQSSEQRTEIIELLKKYSGAENWQLVVKVEENLAGSEMAKSKAKVREIEKEAQEDPGVKAALEAFTGSKIEKVITGK